jgi:hypothetical protein
MTVKFDVKVQARSLSKLMAMAEASMSKSGGALHTERLIDYTSNEFGRLTMKQCLEVLAIIDKDYEKKLFRDGYGEIIGYAHSRRIFIILRRDQSHGNNNEEFARMFVKKVKARKG